MLKPIIGTWFEFRHHNTAEGKYWNNLCKNFTTEQWSEKIEEIASLGMKYMVLMCTSLVQEDEAESYFETDIFPKADMVCPDPMGTMFDAADKYGINIFVSCGFYGVWTESDNNFTSIEVEKRAFKAMKQVYDKYGHHKSFYGWYFSDEAWIKTYFDEPFIDYVNRYSAYAHTITPSLKTLIAPYGTNSVVADEKYIDQLKRMDVDIIAYQDEVGVKKSTYLQTPEYYKTIREAHDAANCSAFWADMEIFTFEDEVYKSALLPADSARVQKQLEAISPYVDVILCYQYQGMVNKPGTSAYCGAPGSEELYNFIKLHNEKYN